MADRKVDVLVPSSYSNLTDRLRRRRNAIEEEPTAEALQKGQQEGARGFDSRTDSTLRRKEDSGRYDGTENEEDTE